MNLDDLFHFPTLSFELFWLLLLWLLLFFLLLLLMIIIFLD